jgi:hypothetical protein
MHENDISLTDAFVSAVNPLAIVVAGSAGSEMDGHREFQKKSWDKKKMRVIDQSRTGGLTVSATETGKLVIQGYADGSETVIRKR